MEYKLDWSKFWRDNAESLQRPFSTDKPMVPVSLSMDDHWLFGEMQIPSTVRYFKDLDYREEIHKLCNDRIEAELGYRHFPEVIPRKSVKRLEEVFESRQELTEGGTPWLESDVKDIDDVKALLERVKKLNLKDFVFPEGWAQSAQEYEERAGSPLRLGAGNRGPITMATSILGTMPFLTFTMDYPEVMDDFFKLLTEKLVEYIRLLREETGVPDTGYWITDDNCCLVSPEQYDRWGAPMLAAAFREFAPEPEHRRHHHSDSDMAHHMPTLNRLGVNEVNLGPNIDARDIRAAMPRAVIFGQIPPMLLRNGSEEEIIAAVRSDIDKVGADGGLVIATAGSVSEGTSLRNIKTMLYAVDQYGRYK
ncbi:MAG: uroporphyrinogen III decarboxylase [Firmicutes bacterium]|nr:uroporphyrinogen III decarboxylase [Bacillota bacterium]